SQDRSANSRDRVNRTIACTGTAPHLATTMTGNIDPNPKSPMNQPPSGLTTAEARLRLKRAGPNAVPDTAMHPLRMAFEKFCAPINSTAGFAAIAIVPAPDACRQWTSTMRGSVQIHSLVQAILTLKNQHPENATMPHAQLQMDLMDLIAPLHRQSLYKAAHLVGPHVNPVHRNAAANVLVRNPDQRLRDVIQPLGILASGAATPWAATDADTSRAAANIETWMTYLPKSCVRTMVSDGWHWTT